MHYSPVVNQLQALISQHPDLAEALQRAIKRADLPNVQDEAAFYDLLNTSTVSLPRTSGQLVHGALEIYFVFGQAHQLRDSSLIGEWCLRYAQAIGAFLDSPASAEYLPPFLHDPAFQIDNYSPGPSGFRTFNQFFARQLKAGKRPIEEPDNALSIAAPCDGTFAGTWPISNAGVIVVKGVSLRIDQLLAHSRWASEFSGGSYAHSYLRITNYHRFHSPVTGEVLEVLNVPGEVGLDVVRNEDGVLTAQPGSGFQFTQERGLIVLRFSEGYAALIPVGMAQISSVKFSVDEGTEVVKGEELGFFQFGGSDVILLLSNEVIWRPEADDAVVLGQTIARQRAL